MDVTAPMEKHIRDCIDKLPAFAESVQYLTVTLDVDSGTPEVEIMAKCGRSDLFVQAGGHDMYRTIDEAFAKLGRRIKRHHDKLVEHRGKHMPPPGGAQ